jgi:hypothetical protein
VQTEKEILVVFWCFIRKVLLSSFAEPISCPASAKYNHHFYDNENLETSTAVNISRKESYLVAKPACIASVLT